MKILTLSNCPLVESQGSGYVIINFCRGLRHLGHEVDLFGPEDFEPFPGLGGMARSYCQTLIWAKERSQQFCWRQIAQHTSEIYIEHWQRKQGL